MTTNSKVGVAPSEPDEFRSATAHIQTYARIAVSPAGSKEVGEEEVSENRTVLVVLRQGSATPHGEGAPQQAKEVVEGVGKWTLSGSETLALFGPTGELVAEFRDWSFVKFIESRTNG